MKKTDKLVQLLNSHIEDKDILEVACGGAEFSISASTMAKSVVEYCETMEKSV